MNIVKDLVTYLSEVRVEFSKITWPSYEELGGSIIIVLLLVFFASLYLGFVDFVLYRLAGYVF